ncbi:LOW QUALITY PROTEIN: hypothetical protein QTO34_016951 [Cnephaeus nilssonii]|uniref:Uncharacterized protein n=1 Tax=Cnephaeus nilssonii TaxID=3371016 RepID=A0AA40LSM7_CNENI|nr:LOW QUALITY PROTEIN: hypothetical protein QTO34_016951 [Eptesicus nilssonii]
MWIELITFILINKGSSITPGMLFSQIDATSQMVWENRIALDIILAVKGGVCVMREMFNFIPNNTDPDGTITKALQGLITLANELAGNAGIDDPFTGWLEG